MNTRKSALAELSRHPRRTPGFLPRARHNAPRESMTIKHRLILALACLPALLASQAHAQDYDISWYTIDAIGMDYSKLTPLLVEAVNALRAEKDTEIASLEFEVDQLREQNTGLESRLAQLEALMTQLAAQIGIKQ